MLYDAMCAAADKDEQDKPPEPITNEEIKNAIESGCETLPERFK